MTLQQLKYLITVAKLGSISKAAKELFISQPSLTNQIHELENEFNITIFLRTNKGVILSQEGEIFLGYARGILEQNNLLEERYKNRTNKDLFCVSTQHYSFSVNAFVDLIKKYGNDKYDFSIRETLTSEIINDVARLKSEVGVLYLDNFNRNIILKLLEDNNLKYETLFIATPHVFISRHNPLAKYDIIKLVDLKDYPYLSFEQDNNALYFSEEILSTIKRNKNIRVRDRATLFNLVIGLNGYTISTGVIDNKLNSKDIVSVKLDDDTKIEVIIITHKNIILSDMASYYIESIKKYVK